MGQKTATEFLSKLDTRIHTLKEQPFIGKPHNFTLLIQALRTTLGDKYEISFAAGGFTKFLTQSIEWNAVMPFVDRVNLMTYDLINGYSTVTGHHTPLYSTP